jgi:hypothetical protein
LTEYPSQPSTEPRPPSSIETANEKTMADFIPNLWESVFVSGPTPTLLIATNATFALLQLVLVLLLAATYSIHFAILSVICGGLWWSINWFAAEVAAVRAEEEAKVKKEKEREDAQPVEKGGERADDEGESTEVEEVGGVSVGGLETSRGSLSLSGFEEGVVRTGREEERGARLRSGKKEADLSGEISTDSEWEKVEDGR